MIRRMSKVRRKSSVRRMSSADVHYSEDVQIQRFPMVGVCPRVLEDAQRILNVKQTFLF